uniref:Uncharacterized protein n=1 Tax=Cacopsylla melanoneura TaxID=428564 RepID=A0A8D8LCS3_9HEMI
MWKKNDRYCGDSLSISLQKHFLPITYKNCRHDVLQITSTIYSYNNNYCCLHAGYLLGLKKTMNILGSSYKVCLVVLNYINTQLLIIMPPVSVMKNMITH